MGKKAGAVQYAEASRGLNQPDAVIEQTCEEILIASGLHDAYRDNGMDPLHFITGLNRAKMDL